MNGTDTGGAGVDRIVYTTDGSTPTSSNGNVYIGAFSVNTNTTIKFVAIDKAGNVGTVGTQMLQVDALAPTTTISCNSAPCTPRPTTLACSSALSATDSGGSGVAAIRYTTDGSDPTRLERHRLRRTVHGGGNDHGQVPRLRQRRQRRGREDAAGHDRHDRADRQPDHSSRRRERQRQRADVRERV